MEGSRKSPWGGGISNSVILREFLESKEESVCIDERRSSYSMDINSWEAVSFGMTLFLQAATKIIVVLWRLSNSTPSVNKSVSVLN